MPARLLLLLITLTLVGFAPAPLPRRGKAVAHPLDLRSLHGRWKVVSLWRYGQNAQISYRIDVWREIRIEQGQWKFCSEENGALTPKTIYKLAIDTTQTPAAIDFLRLTDSKPWMMGIVQMKDGKLEVLYKPSATERPTNFENPPADFYLFTLTRIE